jgi:hypothetical protein
LARGDAEQEFPASAAGTALLKAAPEQHRTFVYKDRAGCEIKADVYRGGKAVAVWIQGGAPAATAGFTGDRGLLDRRRNARLSSRQLRYGNPTGKI